VTRGATLRFILRTKHGLGPVALALLRNESILQVAPLLARELNHSAEVILEDDFLGVREVDGGATRLVATRQRNDTLFLKLL